MGEIRLEPGEIVEVAGIRYEIVSLLSLNEVEVKNLEDGTIVSFPPSKLETPKSRKKSSSSSFDMLSEKQKSLSRERYDHIRPMLEKKNNEPKKDIMKRLVAEHGNSKSTLYEWVKRFHNTNKVSSLSDKRETRGSRRSRLNKKQLAIIDRVAKDYYETPQKPRVQRVIERVRMACQTSKIRPPSESTIRRHIRKRDPLKAAEQREGRKAARDRFGAVYGKFPGADYPLAVVQMDHTTLDIELVDDQERLPIGRPSLTLAMDVFSRAIMGFFVSFENASLLTTGLCLDHAMFPKDDWLKRVGIAHSWPVWGKPVCLHVDNAMEFRSNGLEDFCGEYGVRLEYRPVKTPHYGGHVERVFSTIAKQVHTVPGTNFANIRQKGEYNSTRKAVVTLRALQRWLGEYITGAYLKNLHSSLGMTPLEKWTQGIRGTKGVSGVGVPPILSDREQVRTLLLPTYERSIQRDGIRLNHIQYFSSALHMLFLEKAGKKKSMKVKIKRDPRDISQIKVLDDDRKRWLVVSYRDLRHPSLSLWEWQATMAESKKHSKKPNEHALFETYRNMQKIVEEETKTTKKTRRQRQRRGDAQQEQKKSSSAHLLRVAESKSERLSKLLPAKDVTVYKGRFAID